MLIAPFAIIGHICILLLSYTNDPIQAHYLFSLLTALQRGGQTWQHSTDQVKEGLS